MTTDGQPFLAAGMLQRVAASATLLPNWDRVLKWAGCAGCDRARRAWRFARRTTRARGRPDAVERLCPRGGEM